MHFPELPAILTMGHAGDPCLGGIVETEAKLLSERTEEALVWCILTLLTRMSQAASVGGPAPHADRSTGRPEPRDISGATTAAINQ
jgi:hypothetical protein